jgi:transposase-like protein
MTHTLEPLLTIADIMRIFCVSQGTVYRWLNLSRQGKHPLPLPIGDSIGNRKQKRRLRWSRESILAYLNASNPQASPTTESAAQRQRRNTLAMNRLKAKGVRFASTQQVKET